MGKTINGIKIFVYKIVFDTIIFTPDYQKVTKSLFSAYKKLRVC